MTDDAPDPPARMTRKNRFRVGGIVLALIAGGVVVGAVAVGLLGGLWSESSGRTVVIEDERFAIELETHEDLGVDGVYARPDEDPDCRKVAYTFGADLTIEAIASDCRIDQPQKLLNGDHGTYRTFADVDDPIDHQRVDTDIGPADVFVQHYVEHTNFSNDWEEPVAIVALDGPDDPDFSTLVLRSEKAALSYDDLIAVVESLERPPQTAGP